MIARAQRPSTLDPIHNHFRVPRQLAWLVVAFAAATGACDKVPLFAPTGSAITLSADKLVAPLNSDVKITAVVQESAGTPTQNGTTVNFSSNLGTFEPAEAQTHGGRVTVTFHTGSTSGVATIAATSGAAKAATDANALKITIGAAAVKTVQLSASSTTVRSSGGSIEVSASVLDEASNGVPGVPVVFTTTAGSLSATTATTDASGVARTTLTTNRDAEVKASVGSVSSANTISVKVSAAPTVTLGAVSPSSPQAGQAISFTVTPGTGTTPSVTIDFGDGTTQSLGTVNTVRTIAHTYNTAATYTITAIASDGSGDSSTTTTSVTVGQRQIQTVTLSDPSPSTPAVGQPVLFTITLGTAAVLPVQYVRIDFGDGTTQDLGAVTGSTVVTHSYSSAGTFTVRATLTDTGGGTSTTAKLVTVSPVTITVNPATPTSTQVATFTVNVPPGPSVDRYEWTYSGATSGSDTVSGSNTAQRVLSIGTTTITVNVIGTNGQTIGTATLVVRVAS